MVLGKSDMVMLVEKDEELAVNEPDVLDGKLEVVDELLE